MLQSRECTSSSRKNWWEKQKNGIPVCSPPKTESRFTLLSVPSRLPRSESIWNLSFKFLIRKKKTYSDTEVASFLRCDIFGFRSIMDIDKSRWLGGQNWVQTNSCSFWMTPHEIPPPSYSGETLEHLICNHFSRKV